MGSYVVCVNILGLHDSPVFRCMCGNIEVLHENRKISQANRTILLLLFLINTNDVQYMFFGLTFKLH